MKNEMQTQDVELCTLVAVNTSHSQHTPVRQTKIVSNTSKTGSEPKLATTSKKVYVTHCLHNSW